MTRKEERRLARQVVVAVLLVVFNGGTTSTQAPPGGVSTTAAPPQTPIFRSGVQVIEIDVRVTDRRGQVVRDLSLEDFEILEDGVPQEIRSFSFVGLPVTRAVPVAGSPEAPEPDVTTNTLPEGRVYVVLMDTAGGELGLTARHLLRQFVDEWMAPGDHVAVVHNMGTFTDAEAFTTSKRLVHAAIDREGHSGAVGTTGPEIVAQELSLYRTIEDLSQRLGAINGRRKAILWVSARGIIFDPASRPCLADDGLPDPQNLCAIPRSAANLVAAYHDAIGMANRHNVAVYPIDPMRLTTTTGLRALERREGMRMVAENTGGVATVGTNNLTPAYEAIVRDNSTYYLLAYTPAIPHRDGRFHEVRVRTRRPGLTVRARRGYFAPRPDAPLTPPPTGLDGFSIAAREALRLPLPVPGLGLEVSTAPFALSDRRASVVIGGHVRGDLQLQEGARVGLAYRVFDLENRVVAGEYRSFDLALLPETRARVADGGLRFVERLELPAGRYELRLAVDQADEGVGSVIVPLEVPRFDGALALSGVLLGAASTAGDLTLQADAAAQTALGTDPTAARRFPAGDRLSAYAEIYSTDRNVTAENLSLVARVTTLEGAVMTGAQGRLVPDGPARAGAWGFAAEISLADLPPGRYVLALDATSSRGNRTTGRRIPFEVGAP